MKNANTKLPNDDRLCAVKLKKHAHQKNQELSQMGSFNCTHIQTIVIPLSVWSRPFGTTRLKRESKQSKTLKQSFEHRRRRTAQLGKSSRRAFGPTQNFG